MSDVQKTKLFGARAAYAVGAAHEEGWAWIPYVGAGIVACVMIASHDVSQVEPETYPLDEVKTTYSDEMYAEFNNRIDDMADLNGTIKSLEVDILKVGLDENSEEAIVALEQQRDAEQDKLDGALSRFYATLYASPDITETQFAEIKDRMVANDLSSVRPEGYNWIFDISDDTPEVLRECQAKRDFDDGDPLTFDALHVEDCMHVADQMGNRKFNAGAVGVLKGAFASAILLGGIGLGLNATAGNYYRRRKRGQGWPKPAEFTPKQN